jgi:hypothetical protein
MVEESTKLVDASSDELISHQVLMAEEGLDEMLCGQDMLPAQA